MTRTEADVICRQCWTVAELRQIQVHGRNKILREAAGREIDRRTRELMQ